MVDESRNEHIQVIVFYISTHKLIHYYNDIVKIHNMDSITSLNIYLHFKSNYNIFSLLVTSVLKLDYSSIWNHMPVDFILILGQNRQKQESQPILPFLPYTFVFLTLTLLV